LADVYAWALAAQMGGKDPVDDIGVAQSLIANL
jgi:hypothetical protein